MTGVASKGIVATFVPVDWAPAGLPTEPADIVAAFIDPEQRGELYPLYHQLRERAPVYHCPPEVLHGVWLLSRYDDVMGLLTNPAAVNDPSVVDTAFNHGDGSFHHVMAEAMLFRDSPSHQRLRRLVVRVFTPRAIARWRPIAQRVSDELCDGLAERGAGGESVDLVDLFNYELPFNVIAHILGVPESDFPYIKVIAGDFARAGEDMVSPEVAVRGDAAARGYMAYFEALVEERRRRPTDDLISALVQVEEDGDRLSMTELVCNLILLMQAGHETTQDLLGNAEVALFRQPEQRRALLADPELFKPAADEFLRFDGSVHMNHRLLLEDLTVGGVTIPEGSMVYGMLGAANRDPAQFSEPDRLDVARADGHHVSLGFGAYYCVGASLVRTEVAVGLETLLRRFPDLQPAGDGFEWRSTLLLRGPMHLDVTL